MKIKFFTLATLVLLLGLAACNKDEENDVLTPEDTGYTYDESTNTYIVYTPDGLLAWNVAAQSDLSLNCTLTEDIDLTDIDWTPVGDSTEPYTGTFEGGDHTITGLSVNQSETDYVGLIGYLGSGGKVQNLTLDNVSITGYRHVGGVAGNNYYGTVTNCSASGKISGSGYVGGVIGDNWYGTVTACYASGTVSSSGDRVGGVIGFNWSGTVTACYHASGDVSGNEYVGGVIGDNWYGSVTACYASGDLSGNSAVGGVVGRTSGTVTVCYWSDYDSGFGSYSGGTIDITKVDGEDITWQNAITGMNAAISTSGWKYELLDGNTLPTLTNN